MVLIGSFLGEGGLSRDDLDCFSAWSSMVVLCIEEAGEIVKESQFSCSSRIAKACRQYLVMMDLILN